MRSSGVEYATLGNQGARLRSRGCAMTVIGYADRLSVRPGEAIRFMVSSESASYDARLVRFRGSLSPSRPIEPLTVKSTIDGAHRGRRQPAPVGSYVGIDDSGAFPSGDGLTVIAWIYPGLVDSGKTQGIVSCSSAGGKLGVLLAIDGSGILRFSVGGDDPAHAAISDPLIAGRWYFVAATWKSNTGQSSLTCRMERRSWLAAQDLETTTVGASTMPELC